MKSMAASLLIPHFGDQGPEAHGRWLLIVVNDNLVDITITPGAGIWRPVNCGFTANLYLVRGENHERCSEPTIDTDDKANADGSHTVTITGTAADGRAMLYAYRVPSRALRARCILLALHDAGVNVVNRRRW